MPTIFHRDDLRDALRTVKPAVDSKPTNPIFGHAHVTIADDRAEITATGRSATITTSIPCEAGEPTTFIASHGKLLAMVEAMPNKPLTVDHTGDLLQVSCGKTAKFDLPTGNLDDWPDLPDAPTAAGTVSGFDLNRAIDSVVPGVGKDDTLPMLTGIRIEAADGRMVLAATDRFKLGTDTLDWDGGDMQILASGHYLPQVAKLAGAQPVQILHDGDGRLGLRFGATTVIMRLIDADFPKWRPLLQKTCRTAVRVGRHALLDAIKLATVLDRGEGGVVLDIDRGSMTVRSSGDDERGSATVDCALVGAPIVAKFNTGYLSTALKSFDDERVVVTMQQPGRPAMIWPDSNIPDPEGDDLPVPNTAHALLLMPIRM